MLPEVLSKVCDTVSKRLCCCAHWLPYKALLHIKGHVMLVGSREQDRVHYGCRRVDALVAKEETVRGFTLVQLRREYGAEIHVHVEGESSALM
jgi:hypothetical protein